MADLDAGSKVKGLDFPPTVWDTETGTYTVTATSYGVAVSGGSYVECGVAFVAPTSGRVLIPFRAQMDNDTAGQFTALSPVVREGAVVGSGAVVLAADDTRALVQSGTDVIQIGMTVAVDGLTPYDPYNVRLEHKVGGNTGTIERREVIVQPAS